MLLDGGFFQHEHPVAGIDQADFVPRIKKPVLMVNGRYDWTFPLESSQQPMFDDVRHSNGDKRHVVFDTPHDVPLPTADLTEGSARLVRHVPRQGELTRDRAR